MRTRVVAVAFCAIAVFSISGASHAAGILQPTHAILDVTNWINHTTTVRADAVPATATGIGPGSYLLITKPDGTFICSGGFIFAAGTTRYLSAAGHCFLPADKTATAGPGADYNANQTSTLVCVDNCAFGGQSGAIFQGTMVSLGGVAYARQIQDGSDVGNDFGIVTIPSSLSGRIRTAVPVWGGPTSSNAVIGLGTPVCMFGNGEAVAETFLTMARFGVGVLSDAGAWFAALPSLPGDSGAAVETCDAGIGFTGAGAAGILTHITAEGIAGTTISKAISMATQAGLSISVVHA